MNERDPLRAARLEVVAAGAKLSALGLILPGEGNVSHRLGCDRILVSPTGADKARLDAADLLVVSLDSMDSAEGASCETALHRLVYATEEEVNAIVHAHPVGVCALAEQGRVPDCGLIVEGDQLLGEIKLVPRHSCGSLELAEAARDAMRGAAVCVLAGHGAVAVGPSMEIALRRMSLLERIARLELEGLDG
jgi:L-fuculose-phosphate aldolase